MKKIGICLLFVCNTFWWHLHAAPPTEIAIACANADVAEVKKLVSTVNVNMADNDGQTPLHVAVSNFRPDKEKDFIQVVAYLMQCGANVYARNNQNQTPLSIVKSRIKMQEYKRYNYQHILKIIYPEVSPDEVTLKKGE